MLRAVWKSLLARKVRLLMSTFAISLGVAFVVGSLVFSAALSAGFNKLFGSSVGDVVVRPAGSTTLNGDPSTRTVPASLVTRLESVPGAARVDGNVQALGVFVVGKNHKVVGGLGAPTYGISYSDAPAGHGVPGLTLVAGHAPHGPHEVVLDETTAQDAGYFIGEKVPIVTATRKAVLNERLVGLAGYADNTSLAGATLTIFDVPTAQKLFLKGKDAFSTIWVTADPGVSQTTLRDAVARDLPPGRPCSHRRRRGRRVREPGAARGEVPPDVPADLRRRGPGRRRLPDRQHLLDPGGAAQPRAGAAAGARRLAPPGLAERAARGVRAGTARVDDRARARRRPGLRDPLADRAGRSRPGQRATHSHPASGRRGLRHGHRGDDDGRLAARHGVPAGSCRSRRWATSSRCRSRRSDVGSCWGWSWSSPERRRRSRASSGRCSTPATGSAAGSSPSCSASRQPRRWSAGRCSRWRGGPTPGSSAPSATSPARTPCATLDVRRPPRRR